MTFVSDLRKCVIRCPKLPASDLRVSVRAIVSLFGTRRKKPGTMAGLHVFALKLSDRQHASNVARLRRVRIKPVHANPGQESRLQKISITLV